MEPTRPEGYILGLRLARELKDFAGVQWAATGVLQTAWRKDYEELHREAEDAVLEAERALREAGKQTEADALRDAMARARVRDLFVRLQWSGDGDLDMSVEEPLGTTASCQQPRTTGGGVHWHDGYGPDPKNCYEEYVCAFGMPGVYVVRVRRSRRDNRRKPGPINGCPQSGQQERIDANLRGQVERGSGGSSAFRAGRSTATARP